MLFTNEELTKIYNEANGLDPKRHNSITTERIFTAMRAMETIGRKLIIERGIDNLVASGKSDPDCIPRDSVANMLRKLG